MITDLRLNRRKAPNNTDITTAIYICLNNQHVIGIPKNKVWKFQRIRKLGVIKYLTASIAHETIHSVLAKRESWEAAYLFDNVAKGHDKLNPKSFNGVD